MLLSSRIVDSGYDVTDDVTDHVIIFVATLGLLISETKPDDGMTSFNIMLVIFAFVSLAIN